MSGTKIRVTVWNEFVHERELPEIAAVYPDGIHGAIREFLETNEDIEVKTATLDEPNQGLSRDLLENTDVLIWWSHAKQEEVTDENVRLVQSEVQKGMGLIALHSAHYSKIMRQILGTPMTLKWREHDTEKLWCIDPSHPIAQGVPECIELPDSAGLAGEKYSGAVSLSAADMGKFSIFSLVTRNSRFTGARISRRSLQMRSAGLHRSTG